MAKRGIVLGAAVVAAVAAIGGGIYATLEQPRRFVFDIEIDNIDRIGLPWPETKVLVNGAETPLGHAPGIEAPVVTAPGGVAKDFSPDVLPTIEVQYRYACGWKAVQVALQQPRDDEIANARAEGRNIRTNAEVKEDGWVNLYTDNRGQPAHRIALSGNAADIAADKSATVRLLRDARCAAGSGVTLDGKSIGALPSKPPGRGDTTSRFLFDPSAKRCYTYREVSYLAENSPDLSDGDAAPAVFHFAGGYLYALPDETVDYFLAEPPQQIVVPENMVMPGVPYVQASLVATACAGLPAGPRRSR